MCPKNYQQHNNIKLSCLPQNSSGLLDDIEDVHNVNCNWRNNVGGRPGLVQVDVSVIYQAMNRQTSAFGTKIETACHIMCCTIEMTWKRVSRVLLKAMG
jgi:hypothetical protein